MIKKRNWSFNDTQWLYILFLFKNTDIEKLKRTGYKISSMTTFGHLKELL